MLAPLVLLPPPPRKKRKRFSAEFKLELLRYYDNHTSQKTEDEFGVDAATVRRWNQKANRDRIEAACPKNKKSNRRKSRALPTGMPVKARTCLPAELETALHAEIMSLRNDRIPVDGVFVRTLALARAESHGIDIEKDDPEAFKASTGWLYRFQKRFNLSTRTGTRRKMTEIPADSIQAFYRLTRILRALIRTGRYKYIVNIDEVPIYYDVSVKKTLHPKGAQEVLIAEGGDSKRRITAVFGIISSLVSPEFLDEAVSPRCKSMFVLKGRCFSCLHRLIRSEVDPSPHCSFPVSSYFPYARRLHYMCAGCLSLPTFSISF